MKKTPNERMLAVLRLAKRAVSRGWIKGASAKTANGLGTFAYGGDATCWCASGAILYAMNKHGTDNYNFWDRACAMLTRFLPPRVQTTKHGRSTLIHFNDGSTTTKEDILDLFTKAIKSLKKKVDVLSAKRIKAK